MVNLKNKQTFTVSLVGAVSDRTRRMPHAHVAVDALNVLKNIRPEQDEKHAHVAVDALNVSINSKVYQIED